MDGLGIKPNYAELGRHYHMDWRTVKKYHEGYEGKPSNRSKGSRLDEYKDTITDKLKIKRTTVRGVYESMVKKYGLSKIGGYSNFNRYVKVNNLKPKKADTGHPRFETAPGIQAQADWKEDITLTSSRGEMITFNIFHMSLKFSRFSYMEISLRMQSQDLDRCLINGFRVFGGIPQEILFDNMKTIVVTEPGKKKLTNGIQRFSKDFGFRVRLCGVRSPETKGSVEAMNKIVDWIRVYDGEFEDFNQLIQILKDIMAEKNIIINQGTNMSPTALFYKEKEYLNPLPCQQIIEQYLTPARYLVAGDALIRFNGSKYSVDPKLIGEYVTAESLDNKLYIYYMGKIACVHPISEKPVNYHAEHYKALMSGKVNENEMETRVQDNLKMMDNILQMRKTAVDSTTAAGSVEAMITYLNQYDGGRWLINYFAHLSADNKKIFVNGMNEVLPYVKNPAVFVRNIKFSVKANMCRTLAFDCTVQDSFAASDSESILTEEGFDYFYSKYENEILEFYKDMAEQADNDN